MTACSSQAGPIMKICAMSDLHRHQIDIPKCDVLAIAGDISGFDDAQWFGEVFLPYLKKQKNKYDICFLIFGNHDDMIQAAQLEVPDYIKILTNKEFIYKGIKFFGSPYCKSSPEIIESINAFEEPFLKTLFEDIPENTDVLITHQPPYGFGDTVINQSYHLGSTSLAERIRIVKPKVHIFGHIHTGKKYTKENGTSYYNVSILNDDYELTYKPTIINYAPVA